MKLRDALVLPVNAVRYRQLCCARHPMVLVLSHMRAYTTVLAHVLGSHRAIHGHAETHIRYHQPWAYFRLLCHVARQDGGLGEGYVLDKILHNKTRLPASFLQRHPHRLLITIRRPEGALPSLLHLYRDVLRTGDLIEATDYYVSRLQGLVSLAASLPQAVYFPAERLVDDTACLLQQLSDFLELTEPLTDEYVVFSDTGKVGAGDSSTHIATGRIRREREGPVLEIPLPLQQRAETAYLEAAQQLGKLCQPLPST